MLPIVDPSHVGFLVSDLSRLIRAEFERQIAAQISTVTPAEARVLAHLARMGPCRQIRLAEILRISAMSLSGFLDSLENQGLIERLADRDDRRAKIVRLTRKAEPALKAVRAAGEQLHEIVSRDVSRADWQTFLDVIGSARENLTDAQSDTGETAAQ